MNGERGSVRSALRTGLADPAEGTAVWIVEFAADSVIAWQVRRDSSGTPQVRHWPVPVRPAADPEAVYQQQLRPLLGAGARVLLVCSTADASRGQIFDVVRAAHPEATVSHCTCPLGGVIRQVITETPLTHWYELVMLRRTGSGRLLFDSFQLFPREARHGYRQQFRMRCEPSDEHGTVFAVIAERGGSYRLVSAQSALLAPGVYEPTAELLRPGRVAFDGLPVKLRAEHRSWPALISAVPPRLDRPPPVHLICAIEVTGSSEQLRQRIERIDKLVEHVSLGDGQLTVSLVSYGAHSFHRKVPEEPVTVLALTLNAKAAQAALARLGKRQPPDGEYPRAAQLECALAAIVRLIDRKDGRPVLVTAGSRPPFPPVVDLHTEILPCPDRTDWRRELRRLAGVPAITFGAICDDGAAAPVWAQLGREARESADIVDMQPFAVRLGLSRPALYVPFPLTDADGG